MIGFGRDFVYGLAMLAVGAFLMVETYAPHYVGMGAGLAFDPVFYPRILLIIWFVLSLDLLVRGLLSSSQPSEAAMDTRLDWLSLAGFAVLSVTYVWLVTVIGFFFASIALMVAGMIYLGYRPPIVLVLVGVGFPALLWYVFVVLMRHPLPTSPFFGSI